MTTPKTFLRSSCSACLSALLVVGGLSVGCTGSPESPADAGAAIDAPVELPFTAGTSTLAGDAEPGYTDGPRMATRFANPVNVAYRDGRLYVADFDNGKIRVIDTASHETTTLIAQQGFQRPFGLALAADGTLYVSTDNDPQGGHSLMSGSIWRIAPGAKHATVVAAAIGRPRGLAVLPDGRIAASDYAHHVLQLIDPASGGVTPLAGAWDQRGSLDGTGGSARFATPYGMVLANDGALVVADFDNHQLRHVTLDGVVTTLAGSPVPGYQDGALGEARFRRPQGVAIAASGELYVSDLDNFRIRRVTQAAVTTVAGDGKPGYLDHDDPMASRAYGLEGLAVTPDGAMLYIADGSRGESLPFNRVRQVARRW